MASILIKNLPEKVIEANDSSKTLLQHFHTNFLDWMHACGGKGRCTTCKVIVVEGLENFAPDTPAEERYRSRGLLKNNERLACQAKISGHVTVVVPEEGKLPHINYSEA